MEQVLLQGDIATVGAGIMRTNRHENRISINQQSATTYNNRKRGKNVLHKN